MTTLKDKYLATVWGLHIGDAIWAPFETMNADQVKTQLAAMDGLRFFAYENPWPKDRNGRLLPAGRPTDDSDQAADLCYSLLQCNGIDQSHLREALRNSAIHGVSRLWKGQATGAGRTTRAMLGNDEEKRAYTLQHPLASNGSLMRSAPMALWFGPTSTMDPTVYGTDYQMVKAMSEVTHTHPDSIAACWLYVRILRNALAGREINEVEVQSGFDLRIGDYVVEIERGCGLPEDPGSFENGWGGAEYTLKVAIHAVLTTTSFEDCIRTVGLAGGDTDTYGAVAGALAGAIYGTRGIPKEWQDTILGKKPMQTFAEQIYKLRMESVV